jgi:hypothetical protein
MDAATELSRMPEIQELLRSFEQMNRDRESAAAKRDPLALKMTRVFDEGVSASYRYFGGKKNGKGQRVYFCYSVHRNAAGFFLGWRETHMQNGTVKRDRWVSRRVKARCIEIARSRALRADSYCGADKGKE